MRVDSAVCPVHQSNFTPSECNDCVVAELAWISQRVGALQDRGYKATEAHRVSSLWAKCRRRGTDYPPDVIVARALLEKELFNH